MSVSYRVTVEHLTMDTGEEIQPEPPEEPDGGWFLQGTEVVRGRQHNESSGPDDCWLVCVWNRTDP